MSELLFEYKVRYRYKTGYKEFSFYATTEIEEFLNRNNIEYVRNMTDTVENRLFKEIEILQSKNKKIQTILRTRARQDRKRKAKLRKLRLETTSQRLKLERLNNIINGLEKTISLDFNYVNNDLSDNFVLGIRNEAKSIYRELQELKGSDK